MSSLEPDVFKELADLIIQDENSFKMITDMLNKQHLNLCNKFLSKFCQSLSVELVIKLVVKFGWNALIDNIKSRLIPIKLDNLSYNCDLTSVNNYLIIIYKFN
jgi:hypothetical protein